MAVAAFAPTAGAFLSVSNASAQVALPTTGSPVSVVVTNIGGATAFLQLGTSSAVIAVAPTGLALMPGASVALTITPNTNLAAVTFSGNTGLNIVVGT